MLSNITLGLRGLQMILALAIIGLSASLVAEKICDSDWNICVAALGALLSGENAFRTARFCIFLGLYGVVIAAVGTASLFVDRIPTIVPLVGDIFGALFYLAGGIVWGYKLSKLPVHCGGIPKYMEEKYYTPSYYADPLAGTCRRCEADYGLVWAVFAFTAGLVICDYFRRRNQIQSYN